MTAGGERQRVKKIVLSLVILAGLLVAADYGAAAVAEHRVAQRMHSALGLPGDPTVQINGFPFLTQAVAGDYRDVGVAADRIRYGALQLSVRAHLHHARVPLSALFHGGAPVVRIDQAEGTVLIEPDSLAGQLGIPDLRVDPVSPAQLAQLRTDAASDLGGSADATSPAAANPASTVQLSGMVPGFDLHMTVIASVDVVVGQLQITGRNIQVGSGGGIDELLPGSVQQAILQALSVKIDPGRLPFGAKPTAIRVDGGALAVSGSAQDLTVDG
jgi:hypothetical protein